MPPWLIIINKNKEGRALPEKMEVSKAELQVRLITAAKDIFELVRSRLFIDFRFMSSAIGRLDILNDDMVRTVSTEGSRLYYNARYVIKTYEAEAEALNRTYMHSVLHCVFRHPFVSGRINRRLWDISCDIAVENIINEMNHKDLSCAGEQHEERFIEKLKEQIKSLTAERIYKYLSESAIEDAELEKLEEAFKRDNHVCWWDDDKKDDKGESGEGGKSSDNLVDNYKALEKEWKDISDRMDVDIETISRENGGTKALLQSLKEVNRDKYDYREFLKKFAVTGEDITVNDNEFDYIYYTYGLSKYGNMPLVEPLEYKETQKINDFVIAIDTSGSCQGEIVQKFLEKTYSILSQEESFFKKINVRIIQCDDKIEEEAVIKSKEDFDTYMKFMKIKGFGGTDFRPVFERVDELVEKKEFKKLKGVIYFTDGYGKYPEKMPKYSSAFIFLGYDSQRPQPPSWAIRLVLDESQLDKTEG